MDPIGETQVDTKVDDEVVVNATKDVQQEDKTSTEPTQQKETESSENAQPVEEKNEDAPSTQTNQDSSAHEDDDNKESGKDKEKEKDSQPTQSKQWKNPRKKKSKDEKIPDSAQWPTLDEARIGRGVQKKTQGEPGKNSSKSEREKQSRAKKGINWKPLSDVKSQGTTEQSSSSVGGSTSTSVVGVEGERGGAIQSSGGPSSSAGSGRGYQGGYGRGGQPKRRGGGGRGSWPRSHAGGAPHFSEGANVPSDNVAPETEGKDISQTPQSNQDSASSPPQAGQTYASSESRRYRGSVRGASSRGSSNRYRGGGFSRGPSYFSRYPPRGGVPPLVPPVTVPQDPEQLREHVKKQIEYYFGVDNLCKDIFLRKNMNNEGYISIHLILNFNRVREMGIDLQRFVDALKDSTVVEIKDEFVRRRDDWARWTFPPRIEGAKSSTPAQESTTTESNTQ